MSNEAVASEGSLVLLLDSNMNGCNALAQDLRKEGYRVSEAGDDVLALAMIRMEPVDLILMDLREAKTDNHGFLEAVRELYTAARLPVIVLSESNGTEDAVGYLALGANDYITAPVDHQMITARLQAHLACRRAEAGLYQRNRALENQVEERTLETYQLREALRKSREEYRTVYTNNPAMFFTLDGGGTILSVNKYGAAELRYAAQELVGQPVFMLYPEAVHESLANWLATCREQPETVHQWKLQKRRKDGDTFWVRETVRSVLNENGAQILFMVCEDDTNTQILTRDLSYQASHDVLTGLMNRHEFENQLQMALCISQAGNDEHVMCYLDLDKFMVINNNCGHPGGDELLCQLGKLLDSQTRKVDIVARIGGDEFGILMQCCSLKEAELAATAILRSLEEYVFDWAGVHHRISASIGLVPVTPDSKDISEIFRQAEAACYLVKQRGGNRIHTYRQNDENLARHETELQWVTRINDALDTDQLRLFYQPIMPLTEAGGPAGLHYELLVRMLDRDGSYIQPGSFMPVAEHYGLMPKLDRWVIRAAFRWLASIPDHVARLSVCAINLSGQSLGDEGIQQLITQCLADSAISPDKICFEITETAAIDNLVNATDFIRALKQQGCSISLDDFGSGLSSFAYLKDFPVDFLKIDGQYVENTDDPQAFAMLKAINDIGHMMGKRTVAECVENEVTLGMLREIGVDYAQGYHIGRPRPIEEFTAYGGEIFQAAKLVGQR